jgi:hypothetical protein
MWSVFFFIRVGVAGKKGTITSNAARRYPYPAVETDS